MRRGNFFADTLSKQRCQKGYFWLKKFEGTCIQFYNMNMTAVTLAKRRAVVRSSVLVALLILVYVPTDGDKILTFRYSCVITGNKI